jgi:hypothetical protein
MHTRILTSTNQQMPAELASQARQLQEHFPVLYNYLERRDCVLERALARIPNQADIELGSVFDLFACLEATLQDLTPGIAELARDQEHKPTLTQPSSVST